MEDSDAELYLMRIRDGNDIGLEGWSSVRIIYAVRGRGSLEQHRCFTNETLDGEKNYGFGATARGVLVQVLSSWTQSIAGRSFSDPRLVLLAT